MTRDLPLFPIKMNLLKPISPVHGCRDRFSEMLPPLKFHEPLLPAHSNSFNQEAVTCYMAHAVEAIGIQRDHTVINTTPLKYNSAPLYPYD